MKKDFYAADWKDYLPRPVCDAHPEYEEFYYKTWELARDHVKHVEGMPQDPYMDEAFCDTQIWIWDSCFMSLFCKFAQSVFPGVETFDNFYEVLFNGKTLPEIVPSENEPKWTGAKPGVPFGIRVHIADNPPLFAWAEYENALICGDADHVKTLLYEKQFLQREYEWLENLTEQLRLPDVTAETCWLSENDGYKWEGGRSGMDNTPRGRTGERADKERPNNPDMLWIDAICQQALSAKCISALFAIAGDTELSDKWRSKYEKKKELVNSLYWDENDEFYYDVDSVDHRFYKVRSIASYWTLVSGIATPDRAERMLSYLTDDNDFGGDAPLTSLSRKDADFSENGTYWRGSVWLPTAYMTLRGLENYGYHKEAHELGHKLFLHMLKTYREYEPHTIWECYCPTAPKAGKQTDGTSDVRRNFCGWSALGPITVYLESVLGFHTIDAFRKVVEWAKPHDIDGKIGVENLRFGNVITNVTAEENICTVTSNENYTLIVNGIAYEVKAGANTFLIK